MAYKNFLLALVLLIFPISSKDITMEYEDGEIGGVLSDDYISEQIDPALAKRNPFFRVPDPKPTPYPTQFPHRPYKTNFPTRMNPPTIRTPQSIIDVQKPHGTEGGPSYMMPQDDHTMVPTPSR